MYDGDNTGPAQRRKSLLSFSRDAAERDGSVEERQAARPDGSLPFDHAAARHRLARSRREARPSPIFDALVAAGDAEPAPDNRSNDAGDGARTPEREPATGRHGQGLRDRLGRLMHGLVPPLDGSRETPRATRQQDDDVPVRSAEAVRADAETRDVNRRRYEDYQPHGADNEFWTPLVDPMRVIGAVIDAKRLIVAATVLGALIGVAVALSTPKKYEAATELLVDPRELKLSNLDLTEPGLPSDATLAIVENQVRVLTSGAVLGKVVDKLNLEADPEFNGSRRSFGLRALIGELRGLLSRGDDDGAASDRRHTLAIENLASSLSVERGGKTFVVTIGVQTESADKSALIANTMAEVFLQTYGQLQAQTAGRAADELTARLDELRREVEVAERQVADFKAENEIIDPQGRLITDDELVKLNDQLTVARARTLELNAKAASLREINVDNIVGGAIPETVNSGAITELRSQYAALKTEADRMAARLGPRHPERVAAEAQLASAREQIAAELRRITASIQVEMKRAVELEQQLAKRLAQLKVRHGDEGADLVRLRELEREVATKRAVYESYLLRAKQTGEQRDINTANITVISKAYPPLQPTGPSRAMISIAGMVLGFASGVGLAAMRGAYEALRDRRRDHARGRTARYDIGGGPVPPPVRPSGGAPSGGPSSGSRAPLRDEPSFESRSSARPAGSSALSPAGAQDRSNRPSADEENAMPSHPAAPYHPIAPYPAPAQAWAPPAMPMPPAAIHPAAGQFYPAYGEPVPAAPAYAYAPVPGYPPQPYAPPMPSPIQQHPAFVHAAPAGYPMPAQPVAWHQAYVAPSPQGFGQAYAPPAAQPPVYAAHPAPAQTIPFPGRHAHAPAAYPGAEEEAASRAIDDIRASLAEFREAVRDFTESRKRRRFL